MKGKALSMLLLAILLITAGCAGSANKQSRIAAEQGKPVVYASIYPMYDFAKNIGGDRIDLIMAVPAGAEPHDWEPTARLMVQLEEADVFIYNGVGMEPWADKMLASLTNDSLVVVEASRGIPLLQLKEHKHDHSHAGYDPHVWLDPARALRQAHNIMNALIQADPKNKIYYEENFREFSDKLKDLDTSYQNSLNRVKMKEIVVTHAAFGYLAERYGLNQISVSGLNPREEPSAAELVRLTQLLRSKDIRYVFFETLTSPKLAEVLANEVDAKTEVLNPLGGLTQQQMDEGWDYLSVMEKNLETLIRALGE